MESERAAFFVLFVFFVVPIQWSRCLPWTVSFDLVTTKDTKHTKGWGRILYRRWGGLDSIRGRPMLAIMGEDDKRLPNYRVLEKSATDAGVRFELRVLENAGHKIPREAFPMMREWLIKSLDTGVRE